MNTSATRTYPRRARRRAAALLLALAAVLLLPVRAAAAGGGRSLNTIDPLVVVTGYEVAEGRVEAGAAFLLRVEVSNLSPSADAYNIVASYFFSDNHGFHQGVGEVNQRFLEYLGAGESTELLIALRVRESVEEPLCFFEMNFNYFNANTTAYSNQSSFTLFEPRLGELTVGERSLPGQAMAGQNTLVSLGLGNTGKAALQNVVLVVDGDFENAPRTFRFDALLAGESHLVDTYVSFAAPGTGRIRVSATYENERGETLEAEGLERGVLVAEAAGLAGSAGGGSGFVSDRVYWLCVSGASFVLLLGAVGWLAVARRRKGRG